MRREVLFAILLGIALGGAVAFGIWRANLAFGPKNNNTKVEQMPQNENIATSQLIITQPEDNTISPTEKIIIKGAATPGATVIIMSENDEKITIAGDDGGFEQEIMLEAGPNELLVTTFDSAGNESKQNLVIIYSTEFPQDQ